MKIIPKIVTLELTEHEAQVLVNIANWGVRIENLLVQDGKRIAADGAGEVLAELFKTLRDAGYRPEGGSISVST